jgi:hypothetical protein
MSEPLTLAELQTAKDGMEAKVARLRGALHELATKRPDGWRAEFAARQSELIEAAGRIGRLDKRICAVVESQIVTEEDGGGDV